MENVQVTKKEIVLERFDDVAELNAFIASRPEYATLTFKTSRLANLWELELENDKERWRVGYDVIGFGDISLEYSIAVEQRRRGYIDAELLAEQFQELYVITWKGGYIFTTLPNERQKEVVIVGPQVCGRTNPLLEPVYIWRDVVGHFRVLDCKSGSYIFVTLDEFERWIWEATEEGRKLPWNEWYVIPGIVADERWIDVIKRAEAGAFGPTPDDVVELVRKLMD
jgi:hypothetical protein